MADPIDISSYRATRPASRAAHAPSSASQPVDLPQPKAEVRKTLGQDIQAQNNRETSLDDLYQPLENQSSLVQRARILLYEAEHRAVAAKDALASGDAIEADQQTMLMQGILPELFCCRDVSEGMAAFVLGLFHGVQNQKGKPFTLDQAYLVAKYFSLIAERPFLKFTETLPILEELERAGIDIRPAEASALGELLEADNA